MSYILPKQKHIIKIGGKVFSLYPVYRGNNVWRIRLDMPGRVLGCWLPYEAENKSSIRCVDVKNCYSVLATYLLAARDHKYNFKNFCNAANIPFDEDDNNSKAWGLYDTISNAYANLDQSRNLVLIDFFLGNR